MTRADPEIQTIHFAPTIILKARLPQRYLDVLVRATDSLMGDDAVSGSLDYSSTTTTAGGRQVILVGDQFNRHREYMGEEWQRHKAEVVDFLATLARQYAWYTTELSAPQFLPKTRDQYQVTCRNMWVVSQHAGDYNALHVHPGTNVSGILYLKVPEQVNGANAPDGFVAFSLEQPLDPLNLRFGGSRPFCPVVGDVYLFSSYLPHLVYPFRGAGERRAASFNFFVVPDKGVGWK